MIGKGIHLNDWTYLFYLDGDEWWVMGDGIHLEG